MKYFWTSYSYLKVFDLLPLFQNNFQSMYFDFKKIYIYLPILSFFFKKCYMLYFLANPLNIRHAFMSPKPCSSSVTEIIAP